MMTDPRKNGDLHEPATAPATPWSKRNHGSLAAAN